MRIVYHPEAEAELIESARFYDRRVPGLGRRFLLDVDTSIEKIVESPTKWRVVEGEIRRFLMKKFPFSIYYRVEGEVIRILVFKHHSRHPDYGKHRM
jgi:plasmid stabilization system protein ParE